MSNVKNTYDKILESARKEFSIKGFENSSIRKIASNVGITSGAIYKHFKTKEEIFDILVKDTLMSYYEMNEKLTNSAIEVFLSSDVDDFSSVSCDSNREVLEFIYENFETFQLLFNCSVGTKYENIRHEMVMAEVSGAKKLIDVMKLKGMSIEREDEEYLHMLYSVALTPLFEVITHSYSYEQAIVAFELMLEVVDFGWKKIIG